MFNLETGLEKSTRLKNGVHTFRHRANILVKKSKLGDFSNGKVHPCANISDKIKGARYCNPMQCVVSNYETNFKLNLDP